LNKGVPVQTGQSNASGVKAKVTKVIRAADCSVKSYLETKEDVDVYLGKLRVELLSAIDSGQLARVQ
jgi:hypothetical protein